MTARSFTYLVGILIWFGIPLLFWWAIYLAVAS